MSFILYVGVGVEMWVYTCLGLWFIVRFTGFRVFSCGLFDLSVFGWFLDG